MISMDSATDLYPPSQESAFIISSQVTLMPVSIRPHFESHFSWLMCEAGSWFLTGMNLGGLWAGHLVFWQRLSVYVSVR